MSRFSHSTERGVTIVCALRENPTGLTTRDWGHVTGLKTASVSIQRIHAYAGLRRNRRVTSHLALVWLFP